MKNFFPLFFSLLFILSCTDSRKEEELLYPVVKSDFSDELFLEGIVQSLHSTTVKCSRQIMSGSVIHTMVEDGEIVQKGDTVCILEHRQLMELKETVDELVETLAASYETGVANLESQYATLRSQAKSNEIQAALSNLDSIQMKYYSPSQKRIAELNLQKAKIQKEKYDRNLAALEIINETELKKLKMQLNQGERLKEIYQEYLNELILTAPESGMFLRSESPLGTGKYKEGDEVYSEVVAEIPDPSVVQVMVQAGESAYKRLAVGQKVAYTFSSMPGKKAYGTVTMKTPIGKPLNRQSTVKFFDVMMSVDSFDVNPAPGLSANCLVYLNRLSDTLVVPIVSVFDEDSVKVVYIKQASGYLSQEVTVGLQSSRDVVIINGLKVGDQIAMLRPKDNKIKEKRRLNTSAAVVVPAVSTPENQ